MKNPYSRGSEWRKWDLHVHPPGTKKNDQYQLSNGDIWKEFCQRINDSDVQVFGITDYFSADGYLNFIKQFRSKYSGSHKFFIPNIEVCTTDVVNTAKEEVNLHILFNPSIPKFEEKIHQFLHDLKTSKTDTQGRHKKTTELTTKSDYEEATTTRKFIEEALSATFGDKADLTDYLLIFAAANNDGIRTETEEHEGKKRGKKRKAVITDELDKFSHGFFGNSNNTRHFLNKQRLESGEEIDAKPVVSGCDAHSFPDLDNWLGKVVLQDGKILKQTTWIKADPTFEGLKQIIYEPEYRVFIGEEPNVEIRVRNNPRRYINLFHIDCVEEYDGRHGDWFRDESIELNKELVAIIGNKGSGKSAFTDTIGLVGNCHNQKSQDSAGKGEELFSFLNKDKFLKNQCADNFIGELHWYSGTPDSRQLNCNIDESTPEHIEYLPQKYLEKICTNIEDDDFRTKLNEVIFGYVQESQRYKQNSLGELIKYLTNQAREDIETIKSDLHDENELIVLLEQSLSSDYRREIEERIRLKKEEVVAHQQTKPTVVPKPTEGTDELIKSAAEIKSLDVQITELGNRIQLLRVEQTKISKQAEDLRQAKLAIERQINTLRGLGIKYADLLRAVGIQFTDIVKLSTDYRKLDQFIETQEKRLDEIAYLLATDSAIEELDLDVTEKRLKMKGSLVCQIAQLKARKQEITDRLDKPNRDYQAYLINQAQWQTHYKEFVGSEEQPELNTLNWLNQELNKIEKTYPEELKKARQNRTAIAKKILNKKKTLLVFYNSVKSSIDKEIEKYRTDLADYSISIDSSLRFISWPRFSDEFFRYVNQSVKGSFYGFEDGRSQLKQLSDNVSDWQSEDQVILFLKNIVDYLDSDKREASLPDDNRTRDIFRQMKQNREPTEFYDFLFGLGYLEAKYDLKVDGKDLRELSAGERGGLLLIFYLMLDRREIPLVIDQPEDNLDNKTVYEILVTFLKKAKRRRQIIIATHNPNLAVVADAEQIIHVSIDKKNKNDFSFFAGSIENPVINKKVVDILEGTLPAFNNRKLKYRKQTLSVSAT